MVDRLPPGIFVVVSGPPASGKTTLARAIAPSLSLPLIAIPKARLEKILENFFLMEEKRAIHTHLFQDLLPEQA